MGHVETPSMPFGIDGGVPLYQNLNGPQLGRSWQFNAALRCKL